MRHEKTVVLVDDEREILASFRRLTRNEPYAVRTTTSTGQALEWVDKGEASLVICDQRMPGMDGTEFLDAVGRRSPDTTRVLLTGYPDVPPGPLVLYKPWDDAELKASIRRILQR